MVQIVDDYGAKWYVGANSLEPCLENAEKSKHKFICAKDYLYITKDADGNETYSKPVKIYASYKTSKDFVRLTKRASDDDKNFYVIVPEKTKCCLFNDIEWSLEWKTEEYIKNRYISLMTNFMDKHNILTNKDDFYFLSASEIKTNKGSLHCHNPKVCFNNIKEQEIFMNEFNKELTEDDYYIQEKAKSINFQQCFIDMGIYNKNRCVRLPFSGKKKQDNKTYRHFQPLNNDDYDFSYYTITDTQEADDNIINVSKFDKDVKANKRPHSKNFSQIQELLDNNKTDTIIGSVKGSIIQLKNKNESRLCPLSNTTHNNNNAYLVYKKDGLHFCCHSDKCKDKSLLLMKHDIKQDKPEKEIKFKEPPFKYYYHQYMAKMTTFKDENGNYNGTFKEFQKQFIKDINEFVVQITGSSEPYYLYKVYEEKEGIWQPIWRPKKAKALKDIYRPFSIYKGLVCVLGVDYYDNSPYKSQYVKEDCRPYEKASDIPKDTFNTYDGLFISKERAEERGKDSPEFVLNFIKKAWANDNETHYNQIIKWMAHLIQRPWIKMKSSLVLQGLEGCGKGMIIQLLGKILGHKYFYQPTDISEILGTFNYMLDNKLLVYANEMIWGGDKKQAGILKKLLTEERRTSNMKNMPQRELSNFINWLMDSNEGHIVPAGVRERRYNVFKVGNYIYTLTEQQVKSIYDFCPYSFAKFLYNVDLTGFNPHKHLNTDGLKEQKQLSMSAPHKFILYTLENNQEYYDGTYRNKAEIHDEFLKSSYSGSYHRDPKSFWIEVYKIFGTLDTKRKVEKDLTGMDLINKQQPKRVPYTIFPKLDSAITHFNMLYDCQMVDILTDI